MGFPDFSRLIFDYAAGLASQRDLSGVIQQKKDNGPFASASALEHARQNGYAHPTT